MSGQVGATDNSGCSWTRGVSGWTSGCPAGRLLFFFAVVVYRVSQKSGCPAGRLLSGCCCCCWQSIRFDNHGHSQGDHGDEFYIIMEGAASVTQCPEEGEDTKEVEKRKNRQLTLTFQQDFLFHIRWVNWAPQTTLVRSPCWTTDQGPPLLLPRDLSNVSSSTEQGENDENEDDDGVDDDD